MGINPPEMVAGLLGCIAAQSLAASRLPRKRICFPGVIYLTVGSVLLASLLGPLAAPWFVSTFAAWTPSVPSNSISAAVSGTIGACAQAIMMRLTWLASKLPLPSPKDPPNA